MLSGSVKCKAVFITSTGAKSRTEMLLLTRARNPERSFKFWSTLHHSRTRILYPDCALQLSCIMNSMLLLCIACRILPQSTKSELDGDFGLVLCELGLATLDPDVLVSLQELSR